jgi:hypothetical protein
MIGMILLNSARKNIANYDLKHCFLKIYFTNDDMGYVVLSPVGCVLAPTTLTIILFTGGALYGKFPVLQSRILAQQNLI